MSSIRNKYYLTILLILSVLTLSAQNKLDIGGFVGASYYNGEFNENMPLYKPSPAFGAILRFNFNDYYSFRLSLDLASVKGQHPGNELLPKASRLEFKKSLLSLEAMFEFNFIPLTPAIQKPRLMFTPYIAAGGGVAFINGVIAPNVPFGGGLKFSPGYRHTIGVEWLFHKTFTDKIDDYEAPRDDSHATIHNNDWFSYISLTYTYRLPGGKSTSCAVYR